MLSFAVYAWSEWIICAGQPGIDLLDIPPIILLGANRFEWARSHASMSPVRVFSASLVFAHGAWPPRPSMRFSATLGKSVSRALHTSLPPTLTRD